MDEAKEAAHARETANRWLALGIAAVLVKLDNKAFDALTGMLSAGAVHLMAQGKPLAAEALRCDIAQLKALTQEGRVDAQMALAINALLFLDAGPERREALKTWLETATEVELSNEVAAHLQDRAGTSPGHGG